MATATGTATSYLDLLNQLRAFLTGTSMGTSAWTELGTVSSGGAFTGVDGNAYTSQFESYLKAPGLSGSESIYLNLRAYSSATLVVDNIEIQAAQGYSAGAGYVNQPYTSPGTYLPLWTSSIPYWFIANGQRCIVIAQVGTVYESAYFGKFLPYATSAQYAYPVVVSGSGKVPSLNYTSTDATSHSMFCDPVDMQLCYVDNSWQTVNNQINGTAQNSVWPFQIQYGAGAIAYQPSWCYPDVDGGYPLLPSIISTGGTPASNVLGELDGVFWVPGNGQSSGSTITISGTTYTVFQSAFETGVNNFFAVAMV